MGKPLIIIVGKESVHGMQFYLSSIKDKSKVMHLLEDPSALFASQVWVQALPALQLHIRAPGIAPLLPLQILSHHEQHNNTCKMLQYIPLWILVYTEVHSSRELQLPD